MGIISGTKRRKAAKKLEEGAQEIYRQLQGANEQYLSGYRDLISGGLPELNLTGLDLGSLDLQDLDVSTLLNLDSSVNRTDVNELVSRAKQGEQQAQYGRLTGAEMQRDTVRQSTADALARARNVGGTGLDLLGAIGAIQGAENQAMRDVDITELNRRQSAIDQATQRVDRALSQRMAFDQDARNYQRQAALAEFDASRQAEMFELGALRDAQLAEFNAQRQGQLAEFDALRQAETMGYERDLMGFDLERDLLGQERQAKLAELSQLGATYSAAAGIKEAEAQNIDAIREGVTGVLGSVIGYKSQGEQMDLIKLLNGIGGTGSGGGSMGAIGATGAGTIG